MLTYDPATNGAEWIPMRGTISDLSPAEDTSAQELSNITIPDPHEDRWRRDCFRECREGHSAEAPANGFCAGTALHEEEVMEQVPTDRAEGGSKISEESDSEGALWHSPLRHHHPNSISWVEEESEGREGELTEPTEEPTKEPTEELAEQPAKEPTRKLMGKPAGSHHPEVPKKGRRKCSSTHWRMKLTASAKGAPVETQM